MEYELRGQPRGGGYSPFLCLLSIDMAREALKARVIEPVWKGRRVSHFVKVKPPPPESRPYQIRPACQHTVDRTRFGPGMLPTFYPSWNILREIKFANFMRANA